MTAFAAIGGARPERIRCDRSRSMMPVLTSPSIDVDTCSWSTTFRMTSSDCSLVGTRPAPNTLRARAMAPGSRVAMTIGAGTARPPTGRAGRNSSSTCPPDSR